MFRKFRWLTFSLLIIAVIFLWRRNNYLTAERDRYKENTTALMGEIKRIQIDSTHMALEVNTLRLTQYEYEEYRKQDAELIERLGIRIKDLESAARHHLSVNAAIQAEIRDSIIIRDTVVAKVQTVEMNTPYLQMKGLIKNNHLTGNVHLPVTLNQAVWVEYKRKFLWWRWNIKAIHQTIVSDNPYVEIHYSEYIKIQK